MKRIFIVLAFVAMAAAMLASCLSGNTKGMTLGYFRENISQDLGYDELLERFGAPGKNVGSGIDIYEYTLDDGSNVRIGYVDRILYVKHHDSKGALLETLFELQ